MSEHNSSPENGAVGNKTDEAGTNNVEPGKSTEHATSATPEAGETTSLGYEVVSLSDDFSHFCKECAFLCDAYAAVVSEPECIGEMTAAGLGHSTYRLKKQVEDFHYRIENIYERWRKEVRNKD